MWTGMMIVVLAVVVAAAEAWPNVYDNEFKRWSLSRRSSCKETGAKCYSTNECCKKYVCATMDDEGLNPTTPGWCVHEKELDPCLSSLDCDVSEKCVSLGSSRYCVKSRPKALALGGNDVYRHGGSNGGLNSECRNDDDCNVYHTDGKKLCCQEVRMGRSGTKRRCDRVNPISKCISKRK